MSAHIEAQIIEQNGKPAFALGRSQELTLFCSFFTL